MSGKPMSSRIACGTNSSAARMPAWPVCATLHVVPPALAQEGRKTDCRVDVVVDDQEPQEERARAAAPRATAAGRERLEQRQPDDELAAAAGAFAVRATLPPCSSTRPRTSESPMPSPPVRRVRLRRLRKQLEHARGASRAGCRARVAHARRPRSSPSSPSRASTSMLPPPSCTWPRSSAGCRAPAPGGRVAVDVERLSANAERQRVPAHRSAGGPSRATGAGRSRARAARAATHSPARDPRDVEQVVDEARQVLDWRSSRSRTQPTRSGSRFGALHQLHAVVDRRERVAQLVRQDREELVLAASASLQQRSRRACASAISSPSELSLARSSVRLSSGARACSPPAAGRALRRARRSRPPCVVEALRARGAAGSSSTSTDDLAAQDLRHDGHRDVVDGASS